MALKGIPKSAEHRAKLAAANLGKKHSPETKAKMSAARKGRPVPAEVKVKMSASALGKRKSEATRIAMSIAKRGIPGRKLSEAEKVAISKRRTGTNWPEAQRAKLTGRNSPHWGKTPTRRARVWYRGISFRSSWEVRFAKALDRRGMLWDYEPRRFDLGECTFLPDFFLPETGAYWEVKGWLDSDSQRKASLFRAMHQEPLVIVTKRCLEMMEN